MREYHGPWRAGLLLLLVLTVALLAGCMTRTWIGHGGANSPMGTYSTSVWAFGGYGQAYSEWSDKEAHIEIRRLPYSDDTILLKKKYKIPAYDLASRTRWVSEEEVVIEFFDYTWDASEGEARAGGAVERKIVSIRFRRRPGAEVFEEVGR